MNLPVLATTGASGPTSMGHDDQEASATSGEGQEQALTHDNAAELPQPRLQMDVESDSTIRQSAATAIRLGVKSETSAGSKSLRQDSLAHDQPLPPISGNIDLLQESTYSPGNSLQRPKASRPHLQSKATTALSRNDIHTQFNQDGSRKTFAASVETTPPGKSSRDFGSIRRIKGLGGSEGGDSVSIRSCAPTLEVEGDGESILGEFLGTSQESPTWRVLGNKVDATGDLFDSISGEDNNATIDFHREFDEIKGVDSNGGNEGISALA